MNFKEFLDKNIVILDGGMGTLLQEKGLRPGELPEMWNLTHPDVIREIHTAYYDAGSDVVSTNTFGANLLKFQEEELDAIVRAAMENARRAAEKSVRTGEKFVALDIGPSGKLLKPLGDLDFEEAVCLFAKTVQLGVKYGADLILIETMNDSLETKAALLAAKENSTLPVLVSNAYGEDGKLMTGAEPRAMVAMLEGMGADAVGANCSQGPKALRGVVETLLRYASVPVLFKPNAGLPKVVEGKTVFDVSPEEFAEEIQTLAMLGVRAAGGCCGTTPDYIRALKKATAACRPSERKEKEITIVSSYTHAVEFGASPVLIGERINPTGKKRFKEAIRANDMDYILSEGVRQQEKGVHILDVNVGLPEIDEVKFLRETVLELQTVSDLPLQIDTADKKAMEAAMRVYNGKPMVNSVNGKKESMEAIFPLVKKYGGVVVALTLDENGIPDSAEGRVRIAEKILETAAAYGIPKKDIVFDTLAMAISADSAAADATLEALGRIRKELGCHTSLGVSNVSFGLPNRDAVNGVFFALALEKGLSAAIMNPFAQDMMKTYYAFRALRGLDENFAEYIAVADSFKAVPVEVTATEKNAETAKSELQNAIIKGFKEKAAQITKALLKEEDALDVVKNEIIPALNVVGKGFEEKTVYLPQLLMSAESAKYAFESIKAHMAAMPKTENAAEKGPIVIATVHGDIHDIGKNIVKLLLENYGFCVIDLGKDVPPEKVAEKVAETGAKLCGLSALMTTTVPAMEETIQLLREKVPMCKTVVGGAVLTQEYADAIGADKFAHDAMETVRYAEQIFG